VSSNHQHRKKTPHPSKAIMTVL